MIVHNYVHLVKGEIRVRIKFISRGGEIRTHDLMVPNHARYQLRYTPLVPPAGVEPAWQV